MKVTKEQLKQLINEELEAVLDEHEITEASWPWSQKPQQFTDRQTITHQMQVMQKGVQAFEQRLQKLEQAIEPLRAALGVKTGNWGPADPPISAEDAPTEEIPNQ